MTLALHPFVVNQAFRQKYPEQALSCIAGHEGVWPTTSDEITAHYLAATRGAEAVKKTA
jgi:allantoinase